MLIDSRQRYDQAVLAVGFHGWIDISAPLEVVFGFLSREKGLNKWWSTRGTADPRPGGELHFIWESGKHMTGDAVFRRFEPPNRVTWEWTHSNGEAILCDGSDPRGMRWPALNIFELALIGANRTRVHLHDLGIQAGPKYEQIREATGEGWVQALNRLKAAAELAFRQMQAKAVRQTAARKKTAD